MSSPPVHASARARAEDDEADDLAFGPALTGAPDLPRAEEIYIVNFSHPKQRRSSGPHAQRLRGLLVKHTFPLVA